MSVALFFCATSVLIQFLLALLVLLKDYRKLPNQLFSLLLFLFLLWSLAEGNLIINEINAFAIKLLFTPAILLSFFFCIFSSIYPTLQSENLIIKNRFNSIVFFLPAALLLYLLWSNQLFELVEPIPNGFAINLGKFEFLSKGIIIGYLLYSLTTLSRSRAEAKSKIQKRRLRYTFTAMLLPIAAGSIIIAAGKWFIAGQTAYTFGMFPLLSIIMSSILAYTMLKYNLMEIDLIFSIGLVYTLLTAILAGIMELFQELMQNFLNFSGLWANIISVLLIASFFSPLKDLIIKTVDKIFGRQSFDSASVMQHILTETRNSKNLQSMLTKLKSELKLILDFTSFYISIKSLKVSYNQNAEQEEIYEIIDSLPNLPAEINEIESLADFFATNDDTASTEQLKKLKLAGYRNLFQIQNEKQTYGYLLLGGKKTKVPYTETEINLVNGLCKELPHLIENLEMLQKMLVQDRNQQEIQQARKMLESISFAENKFSFAGLNFITYSSLSHQIKGDLIDFSEGESNNYLALYDAFHHGIPAVLTLNIIFSVFRSVNDPFAKFNQTESVLRCFHSKELCAAATLIKGEKNKFLVINAGNPPPLLITGNQPQPLKLIDSKPLGLTGTAEITSTEIELTEDSILIISTNGLYKAFEKLCQQTFSDFLKENKFSCPPDCYDKIIARLNRCKISEFTDDITFVVAGRKK
ncbi:MAG: PP2C family protein-serine/threonine phosphatase [Candidatus Rifleibacteriota bacterium]